MKNITQRQIAHIERRLPEYGMNVSRVIERAEINRTSWHNWKNGINEPNRALWRRVVGCLPAVLRQEIEAMGD